MQLLIEIAVKLFKNLVKSLIKKAPKAIFKKVTSPFRVGKSLIKNPKKFFTRKISSPIRAVNSKIKRAKKLGKYAKLTFTPRKRLIEETYKNASILNNLIEMEQTKTKGKINKVREQNEIASHITDTKKFLDGFDKKTIDNMNKTVLKTLNDMGLKSSEEINRVIEDEEFREDIVKTNSYETYMNNWKDGFFGYAGAEQGLTKEEMDEIWEQIELDNTFDKFVEKKSL